MIAVPVPWYIFNVLAWNINLAFERSKQDPTKYTQSQLSNWYYDFINLMIEDWKGLIIFI